MTKERYDKAARWILAHPLLLSLIKTLNKRLPAVVYVAYPLLLAYLALSEDGRLWRVLIVPAVVFVSVTVLRRALNLPRPYEKLAITPLIDREGKGQSFPSRHASSAAVIAAAFWYVWPPAGAALSVVALLIALIRPLAGLHFPRDVIGGVIFALTLGIIGFWHVK